MTSWILKTRRIHNLPPRYDHAAWGYLVPYPPDEDCTFPLLSAAVEDIHFAFNGYNLIRTALYFLIVKADVAWNTDFSDVSRPRWHFSLGPEF